MKLMKKLIATILTAAFIVAIVATPGYKVNSPTFKVGSTISGKQSYTGGIFTQ